MLPLCYIYLVGTFIYIIYTEKQIGYKLTEYFQEQQVPVLPIYRKNVHV